jgi:phospholipid N-methyltransferase
VFLRQTGERFQTTGSIMPSSRFLARAITRHLARRGEETVRVLECGPGTGAVTNHIVRHLRPGDRFDLVELNEVFVKALKDQFATQEHWRAVADLAEIHAMPLQEFHSEAPYDFIISGLPHTNLPAPVVEEITDCYFQLLKPGGTLSYYEYILVRSLRKAVSRGAARKQIQRVDRLMAERLHPHRFSRDSVLLNALPAWVHHMRID